MSYSYGNQAYSNWPYQPYGQSWGNSNNYYYNTMQQQYPHQYTPQTPQQAQQYSIPSGSTQLNTASGKGGNALAQATNLLTNIMNQDPNVGKNVFQAAGGVTNKTDTNQSAPAITPTPPVRVDDAVTHKQKEKDEHKLKLKRTVTYLVASQMSKYLPSKKLFNNNMDEFKKSCEHIIQRILDAEIKTSKIDCYKSRKLQTRVLNIVSSYMQKYGTAKTEKIRRKRDRYTVDLAGSPFVTEEADEIFQHSQNDENFTPSKRRATEAIGVGDDLAATMDTATETGEVMMPSPATLSLELPLSARSISKTKNGVKVDYGFAEEEDEVSDPQDKDEVDTDTVEIKDAPQSDVRREITKADQIPPPEI